MATKTCDGILSCASTLVGKRCKVCRMPGGRLLTVKLNGGLVVLAKLYKGEPSAVGFANRTQARNAQVLADAVGVGTEITWRGRPFYVRLHPQP